MIIGNCVIECESILNKNDRSNLEDLTGAFVPKLYSDLNCNNQWKIRIKYSDKLLIHEDYLETNINIQSKDESFLNSLALLIGVYTSILREKDNIYTLHSSSISIKDKSILFVGENFSGKSTLAILAAKEFGFKISSLNNTCIKFSDEIQIVGGSYLNTIRRSIYEIINVDSPKVDSLDYFSLMKSTIISNDDFFFNKSNIKYIFFLIPWGKSLRIKAIDQMELSINLFNFLSKLPRTSVVFSEPIYVSKIWDINELYIKRYKTINMGINDANSFFITGSPENILNHIKNNLI